MTENSDFSNFDSLFDKFPIVGLTLPGATFSPWNIRAEEISFSGLRQNICVCFIDMISSTKIAASISDVQSSRYYEVFLNSMAHIVKNFGGKIMKNQGDCLIYYFPQTSDLSKKNSFSDVLECGLTMIAAHRTINAKLSEENLPPVNYRISAVYGRVEFAKSTTSVSDDLFGSTVNLCSKINAKAPPNGMVIGDDMYEILRSFSFDNYYNFKEVGEYQINSNKQYLVYSVANKEQRNILNPFKRTSSNSSD